MCSLSAICYKTFDIHIGIDIGKAIDRDGSLRAFGRKRQAMMTFDDDLDRKIDETLDLYSRISKTNPMFHPKDRAQLETLLLSPKAKLLCRYDIDGKMIASMLVSDKKFYQSSAVETYGFLRYLIGSQENPITRDLPDHPDIFWLECLCVDDERRGEGIAKELMCEAYEYALETADELPAIVSCGIMVGNEPPRQLAARCSLEKIDHAWTQRDFADDGSFDKDFSWNIYYNVLD